MNVCTTPMTQRFPEWLTIWALLFLVECDIGRLTANVSWVVIQIDHDAYYYTVSLLPRFHVSSQTTYHLLLWGKTLSNTLDPVSSQPDIVASPHILKLSSCPSRLDTCVVASRASERTTTTVAIVSATATWRRQSGVLSPPRGFSQPSTTPATHPYPLTPAASTDRTVRRSRRPRPPQSPAGRSLRFASLLVITPVSHCDVLVPLSDGWRRVCFSTGRR